MSLLCKRENKALDARKARQIVRAAKVVGTLYVPLHQRFRLPCATATLNERCSIFSTRMQFGRYCQHGGSFRRRDGVVLCRSKGKIELMGFKRFSSCASLREAEKQRIGTDYCCKWPTSFGWGKAFIYSVIKTDSVQSSSNTCKNYLLKIYSQHGNFLNAIVSL